jgi:hypothetical protein
MEGRREYGHRAHAVFDLKYHLIWCPRYRYKILCGRVAEHARDLIRQICEARDVVIIGGAVSPGPYPFADGSYLLSSCHCTYDRARFF